MYVLLIKNVNPDDTDVYVCEVNSDPMLRSFHPLRVKTKNGNKSTSNKTSDKRSGGGSGTNTSKDLTPVTEEVLEDNGDNDMMPSVTHDFTECCDSLNVSLKCKGFCSVHNIIDGSTGVEPEACEKDFSQYCQMHGRRSESRTVLRTQKNTRYLSGYVSRRLYTVHGLFEITRFMCRSYTSWIAMYSRGDTNNSE